MVCHEMDHIKENGVNVGLKIVDVKSNGTAFGFFDRNEIYFSWKTRSDQPDGRQTAWQIRAVGNPAELESGPYLWDSGWVESDQSVEVPYAGAPLTSRQSVVWQVRIRDNAGNQSDWSRLSRFEMAFLEQDDWCAQWIQMPRLPKDESVPAPFFRKSFKLSGKPVSARLYVAALGDGEFYLNGTRIGNDYFSPGWTDFSRRVQYMTYDVSTLLQDGENAIGAILGDGWYSGRISWKNMHHFYGPEPRLRLQLEARMQDGRLERIISDSDWLCATGPIVESDHYNGEIYDARKEMPGWNTAGFDAGKWLPVRIANVSDQIVLQAKTCPPVRKQEELPAVSRTARNGVWIYDLGQNMVGWARIKIRARSGAKVRIRFAEMLQADGSLYTENYRSARSEDLYICKSSETETWEPHFTFHGFRYVELSGDLNDPALDAVTGVVLHTDLPKTGGFECSDPLINRLQKNILWGQKSNFFEVPTDCPQRDERLGWTGDAQVFARTAAFNMDIYDFYAKWLTDVRDAQRADGAFPDVAPYITCSHGNAGWGDAGVICPWELYWQYGRKSVLEQNYDAMSRWISFLKNTSNELICPETLYGDWLAIDPPESATSKKLIGTAYFIHCTDLLAETAAVLNRMDDVLYFQKLASDIRCAFDKAFVSDTGAVAGETQTGYLLSLGFDLLPEEKAAYARRRLAELVESKGHLMTGFIGTPLLNPVLTRAGRADLAYNLLFRREYPSWLYPIDQGATTMWERWNSYSHVDGFGKVSMNSFNHYAYGAIGEWLYHDVAGIQPASPGYREIELRPLIDPRLTFVKAWYESSYGRIQMEWKTSGETLTLCGEIPFNTEAVLWLPNGYANTSSENPSDEHGGIRLGSGSFHITAQKIR